MSLSNEVIEEFKEIYYKEHKMKLGDAEALELATRFFNLMRTVYQPIPKQKNKK